MVRKTTYSIALCFSLSSELFAANCAPEHLLHVVSSLRAPDIPAEGFNIHPKILYRLGAGLGRIEEAEDTKVHLHLLIVAHDPDIWMVNLVDHAGQHNKDPEPPLIFRVPVLPPETFAQWQNFEFGCEVDFMKNAHADRVVLSPTGHVKYSLKLGGTEVQLFTDPSDKPLYLRVLGAHEFTITYDKYEYLPPNPSLFEKPAGVRFVEAQQP